MAILRSQFIDSFEAKDIPNWSCPTCYIGTLKCDPKNITSYESALSLSSRDFYEVWEPTKAHGNFYGVLNCCNSKCNETVAITGYMICTTPIFNLVKKDYKYEIIHLLTPLGFNPPIHIFQINQEVPSAIRNEIIFAFNLYWYDTFCCAARIRMVVEFILDDIKVPGTYTRSNKKYPYSLYKRIQLFGNKNKVIAALLMSIQWIANPGDKRTYLSKKEILTGFEILELFTIMIYDPDLQKKP